MNGRPWTSAENRYLRRWYKRRLAAEVAAHLDRSLAATYMQANQLGLVERRDPRAMRRRQKRIRTLLARQWSDSEVAEAVGVTRESVRDWRQSQGIEANGYSARYRRRVARKTRQQCREAGVRNLGELRARRLRETVRKFGWPDHLTIRAAQIAQVLYARGPMTRRQIADAIGMPWKGSRKSLAGNGPGGSYLAELARAGIVVRLPKAVAVRGQGKGKGCDLYFIAIGVEPCPPEKTTAS